nr:MAG TPA: hypothetical protein [Caudoviricetes sp.]
MVLCQRWHRTFLFRWSFKFVGNGILSKRFNLVIL